MTVTQYCTLSVIKKSARFPSPLNASLTSDAFTPDIALIHEAGGEMIHTPSSEAEGESGGVGADTIDTFLP
jgi:hypothetical protein